MSWLGALVRLTPDAQRERIIAALFAAGAQGLHEQSENTLLAHFPPGITEDHVLGCIAPDLHGSDIEFREVVDTNWAESWKWGVRAHKVGALTVTPPWLAEGCDPHNTIIINPAMAFGTGEHPTTRGVLHLMQAVVLKGDRVADLGAGSAVLSIAAAKLGASMVAAIEEDPDAIETAEENVELNGVADRVRVIQGDAAVLLPLVAPVRIVLANIQSLVILPMLPIIARALSSGGRAILSGILEEERGSVLPALARDGWRVLADQVEESWWTLAIGRR